MQKLRIRAALTTGLAIASLLCAESRVGADDGHQSGDQEGHHVLALLCVRRV